jgi:hypothetical protein
LVNHEVTFVPLSASRLYSVEFVESELASQTEGLYKNLPTTNPHDLTWYRIWAAVVGSR